MGDLLGMGDNRMTDDVELCRVDKASMLSTAS